MYIYRDPHATQFLCYKYPTISYTSEINKLPDFVLFLILLLHTLVKIYMRPLVLFLEHI